jgi:hypothetical protein
MQQRLKAAGRFIWKNADGCLVVGVAFGVVILEVLGNPSPDLLDSAILGLLGVTAIVLLRDREGGMIWLRSDSLRGTPSAIALMRSFPKGTSGI